MVRKIMRDEAFLSQRAEPASLGDLEVARDLLDSGMLNSRLAAASWNVVRLRKA